MIVDQGFITLPIAIKFIGNALESTIALGIGLGLIFGKLIGIAGCVILAEMMGIGRFPKGVQRSHIIGAAFLAGIGLKEIHESRRNITSL